MKKKHIFLLVTLLCCAASPSFGARAGAPVVDLSGPIQQDATVNQSLEIDQEETPARATQSHQNEPMDQRVLRLERQVNNLADVNNASKLEKVQQQLQQLQGQIEVQNHELIQLREQVKSFYQDLDQRVGKLKSNESLPQTKKVVTAQDASSPTAEKSANANNKELQAYETAFNLLNKKEYDQAISGFQEFVKEYPASTYTVNAHYWLGEIYYLKGKPSQANTEFQTIVTNYPDNPKVADAMLKMALISMDAGNYSKAKQHLTKVQKQFPGSTAANIAALRLKEIKH